MLRDIDNSVLSSALLNVKLDGPSRAQVSLPTKLRGFDICSAELHSTSAFLASLHASDTTCQVTMTLRGSTATVPSLAKEKNKSLGVYSKTLVTLRHPILFSFLDCTSILTWELSERVIGSVSYYSHHSASIFPMSNPIPKTHVCSLWLCLGCFRHPSLPLQKQHRLMNALPSIEYWPICRSQPYSNQMVKLWTPTSSLMIYHLSLGTKANFSMEYYLCSFSCCFGCRLSGEELLPMPLLLRQRDERSKHH